MYTVVKIIKDLEKRIVMFRSKSADEVLEFVQQLNETKEKNEEIYIEDDEN